MTHDGVKYLVPPLLAVDADGYCWRVFEDGWSMAPNNPDNEPIPQPVTFYVPFDGGELDEAMAAAAALGAALARFDNARDALVRAQAGTEDPAPLMDGAERSDLPR